MKKKMKRIVAAALSCLVLLGLIPITSQTVGAMTIMDDWGYEIIDDESVAITGYFGNDTEIVIPNTIGEYKVIEIRVPIEYKYTSENGFKTVDSITISDGINTIDDNAFAYCSNLTSIIIPDSVTYIGDYAFYCCKNLSSVKISDNITEISEGVFYGCINLSSIEIPDNVVSIGAMAFEGCQNLSSIKIPENVTAIGDSAFNRCDILSSIDIPDSVISISSTAFKDCNNLNNINVNVNNTIYSSDDGILYNKDKTEIIRCPQNKNNVKILNSVEKIGNNAFYNCKNLTSIEIPNNVTSIGNSAFCGCENLVNIKIPDNVISIGKEAFWWCSNLASIKIPEGVTKIEEFTFDNCTNLITVEIPSSVTSIGLFAFSDCVNLSYIEIYDSVTNIHKDAFDGSENLIIYGYIGSYVESYANSNDIPFVELKNINEEDSATQEIICTGNIKSSINTSEEDLYKAVFNDKEFEQIESGANVSIELKINEISSNTDNTDKLAVETALPSGYKITNYFDITLTSKINETTRQITETNSVIEIEVDIPTETTGTYQVIRLHNGTAEILPTTIKDGKLVFSTDKFSTYAIIYKPALNDVEAGNNSMAVCAVLLAGMSVMAVGAIYLRKKKHVTE